MDDGCETFIMTDPLFYDALYSENGVEESFPMWLEARRPIGNQEARLVVAGIAGTSTGWEK